MKIIKRVDANECWFLPSKTDYDRVDHTVYSKYSHDDVMRKVKLPMTKIDRLDTPSKSLRKYRIQVTSTIIDDITNFMTQFDNLYVYAGDHLPTYETLESGESVLTWYCVGE